MKSVMSLTVKADVGVLLFNAKQATPMQKSLLEVGHLQPFMPVQTENSTAFGMVKNKIIPKNTKAIDIQYHWLWDRKQQ